MDREFCKECSKCGERSMSITMVPYEVEINHDARRYLVKISGLSIPQCSKCGNISHDHEASEQIGRAFRKQAGLLDPEEIRDQRGRLKLTQEELADMLDVEVSELSRWENGGQIQSRSLDRFLRAFFNLPELRKALADKEALELSPV